MQSNFIGGGGPLGRFASRWGIHGPTFAVVVINFGSALMQVVFMFYYVKVFQEIYRINERWFYAAQILFMFWNALNDPLFGYFQDLGSAPWLRNRKLAILRGAPWWALSFMLPWIPFGDAQSPPWVVGMHLIATLFFYDGLLTFVLLAHSALFAEITNVHSERVRIIKYLQAMTFFGVLSLPVVTYVSSGLQNFHAFQMACALIAFIADCRNSQFDKIYSISTRFSLASTLSLFFKYLCMWYTGTYAPPPGAHIIPDRHLQVEYRSWADYWRCTKEILGNRDFLSITLANFMHVLRSTSHLNFAPIFTEALIPETIFPRGGLMISGFYAFCAQVPQIFLIIGSPLITKYGPHRVLSLSCAIDVMVGIWAFAFGGPDSPFVIISFMIIDSILTHACSPLMNILFPDVIDEDAKLHQRKAPLSSMIFALNALVTKPAQSLAPMIAVYSINRDGLYDAYNRKTLTNAEEISQLKSNMFTLLALFPVIACSIEFLLLRFYRLKKKHLNESWEEMFVREGVNF